MTFSIAKTANWLHQVHRSHAMVDGWPGWFALENKRTAYRVQDALLKKLLPKQGPLVGYISLTAPKTGSRPACPAYRPILGAVTLKYGLQR